MNEKLNDNCEITCGDLVREEFDINVSLSMIDRTIGSLTGKLIIGIYRIR
jgi:hypothetical protein